MGKCRRWFFSQLIIERFAVWMRTSGLPDFKKTWGKIDQDIKAGEYTIEINNS